MLGQLSDVSTKKGGCAKKASPVYQCREQLRQEIFATPPEVRYLDSERRITGTQ